uniref:FAD-dependent monooxygenase n=1 Tax=Paractinoplanes polyasparticus TaxID=2856853 RepID=UPI0027E13EF2|nr:FAD-dependent monooxygenase [Actinoplanes polyasparticus]
MTSIIAATDKIFAGWNTYDVPALPSWHRGRMIVIGDAVHASAPSIGQGAAMAIEDAMVLAQSLRDSGTIESASPPTSSGAGRGWNVSSSRTGEPAAGRRSARSPGHPATWS